MNINIGDILYMKKPHPCGCCEFRVDRIGMDFKLTCLGCSHQVMAPRKKIEKHIKKVISQENADVR